MRRVPVNVAFEPELIHRVRVTAAQLNMRVSDLIGDLIKNNLPEKELQAQCNKGKIKIQ